MFDRAVRDADWVVNKVITSHTQETKCSVSTHNRTACKAEQSSSVAVYKEDSPDTGCKRVTAMSPFLDKPILMPSSTAAPVWEHNNEQPGSQYEHTTQRRVLQASVMIWSAAALLGWTISSSGLILLNKELMVTDGFKYPMALTAAGQLTSYLGGNATAVDKLQSRCTASLICLIITSMPIRNCCGCDDDVTATHFAGSGLALAKMGFMTCRPWPNAAFFLKRLLPIVILSAISLVSGNMAYLSLSVAFIQVLKVLLPAITLAVGVAAGIERLTLSLTISVFLISVGTGYAAVLESQTSHFSLVGFAYFLVSAACEASRTVMVQLLLGKMQYNAVEALVYLSPMTAVCLGFGAFLFEWDGLTAHHGGMYKVSCHPTRYLLAASGGFVVNLTTFWAIKATSGLTFKVLGCVKNSFVVCAGVLMGDVISLQQMWSYFFSVVGFVMYTYTKSSANPVAEKKSM